MVLAIFMFWLRSKRPLTVDMKKFNRFVIKLYTEHTIEEFQFYELVPFFTDCTFLFPTTTPNWNTGTTMMMVDFDQSPFPIDDPPNGRM